jgi:hypothetical protein
MPSEKAKENKTLVGQCLACGKSLSTELIHGVLIERQGRRTTTPICDACRAQGWQPPDENA